MADKDVFKANMARVKDIQRLADDLRASITETEGKLSALKPRDPIVVQNLKDVTTDKKKELEALDREYFDLVGENLTFEANSGIDPNADALTKLATMLQNNLQHPETRCCVANWLTCSHSNKCKQFRNLAED